MIKVDRRKVPLTAIRKRRADMKWAFIDKLPIGGSFVCPRGEAQSGIQVLRNRGFVASIRQTLMKHDGATLYRVWKVGRA